MKPQLRRFLVLFGGSIVAAIAITIILAPPGLVASVLTFLVIMVGGTALSYAIGYLDTSWEANAYASAEARRDAEVAQDAERRSATADHDREESRWLLREWVGVAIASLFGLLLLALFLLEATGVVSELPVAGGAVAEWAVLVVLALTLVVLGLWSWRGRGAEPK